MKLEDITAKLLKVEGWEKAPGLPGTFMERVPYSEKNTIHYLRPVTAKAVVGTSTHDTPEDKSLALADKLLTFAAERLPQILKNPTTKVSPFDSGIKGLDSFLALGPAVAQFYADDTPFFHKVSEITASCYAVNRIEFSGNETEQEALAREKNLSLGDLKRRITPVIFARFQKKNGQGSHKHLAVGTHAQLVKLVEALPKDGGFVELENWERARLVFTAGKGKIEAAFGGESKPIALKAALELLEVLTHKDAEAAQKLWGK
jgi:hypothetical protein